MKIALPSTYFYRYSFNADCLTEFHLFPRAYTQEQFGDLVWKQALRATGCKHTVFNTHQIYPDSLMPDLAEALSAITYVFIRYFDDDNEREKRAEKISDPFRIPNKSIQLITTKNHILILFVSLVFVSYAEANRLIILWISLASVSYDSLRILAMTKC